MKTTLLVVLIALGTSQFVYLVFQSPIGFLVWGFLWVVWFVVRFHWFFFYKDDDSGGGDDDNY